MEKPKNRLWEIKRRPLLLALLPLLFPAGAKGQSATPSEAMALEQQGKLEEALKIYRDGLAIRERLAAADRSNTEWQRDLSISYEGWGKAGSTGQTG